MVLLDNSWQRQRPYIRRFESFRMNTMETENNLLEELYKDTKELRSLLLKFYENDPGRIAMILFAEDGETLTSVCQILADELINTVKGLLEKMDKEEAELQRIRNRELKVEQPSKTGKTEEEKKAYRRLVNAKSRLKRLKYTLPREQPSNIVYYTKYTDRHPLLEKRYAETYGFIFETR